jgi:hypothetical protein
MKGKTLGRRGLLGREHYFCIRRLDWGIWGGLFFGGGKIGRLYYGCWLEKLVVGLL